MCKGYPWSEHAFHSKLRDRNSNHFRRSIKMSAAALAEPVVSNIACRTQQRNTESNVSLPWLFPNGVLPQAAFSQARVSVAMSLPCRRYRERNRTIGRKVESFLSMSLTTMAPISGG